MTTPTAGQRTAAEDWFLQRGLPSVIPRRARWRGVWQRSAPALAGYAALEATSGLITLIAGGQDISVDEDPGPREIVILVLLGLTIPVAFTAGWLVSRISSVRRRKMVSTVSVVVAFASNFLTAFVISLLTSTINTALLVAVILWLTGRGIGSVLGWALRLTGSHLAQVGRLVARALPVVLLTVLVFFNGFVWSMAAKISRERMWLVTTFMVVIAIVFLISGIRDRVRPMLASSTPRETDTERLADTPFAGMSDPEAGDPLRRRERANAMFVIAASQVTQVAMVALTTCLIFFALGLMALSPDLVTEWTKNDTREGTWLWITLPVPQALIHVTMFLGALTFMYVSARAVGDGEYRSEFLDPLVDDLRLTLVARNRYREHLMAA